MRDDLDPDGCRRLAAAVIGKAVAHEGLPYTASRDFDLWSAIAGANPAALRRQIQRELARGLSPSYHAERD